LFRNFTSVLVSFGPWGIFVLSIVDSLGVPLPAALDFLLIGLAAASSRAPHRAYLAALLAVVGSTGGNIGLFMAARHGRRLVSKGQPPPERRHRLHQWFYRYGLLTVFIPAITPVVPLPLKIFVVSAGALQTPVGRFTWLILLARVIRYFGLAYLGLQLGADAQGFLARNGWTLAGAAIGLALALYWMIRLTGRRREGRPDPAIPVTGDFGDRQQNP
jgi:membrane protein YqaA with SNARE-associated domain